MRSLTTVCGVSWLVLAGALAIACEDDNSGSNGGGGGDGNSAGTGEPSDGGTPGSGASSSTGGKAGSAGAAGSGEGGEMGSVGGMASSEGGDGPGGSGGPATGEGGAGGGGGEPVDPNLCENFPVTVTGGPTIQLNVTGAILCLDPCRITTNTYSDGEGACDYQTAPQIGFWVNDGQAPAYDVRLPENWTWESASAGTINQTELQDVPEGTEVTAVISDADENEHTLVFTFPGNGQITISSFFEN